MKNEDVEVIKAVARSIKLTYGSDSKPGYTRVKLRKKFVYLNAEGNRITDEDELKRIKSLVIPPAWTKVWISPKTNSHLQATGIDAAGRKQYKYHPLWSIARNERKHNRMAEFAKALPAIRNQVQKDLRKQEFTKHKVVALAISVIDKTFIRIGNATYTKLYGSYGLTSLRNRHITINGSKMNISFIGKKGVQQDIQLTHASLSRLLKRLKDIPGQELFQYFDTDGTKKTLESGDINQYIEACTGKDFTAKDFRTWWGTVSAAVYLAGADTATETKPQKLITDALDHVAKKLGNTRTVCKKYYVHPKLLSYFEEGKLDRYIIKLRAARQMNGSRQKIEEKIISDFIKRECATTAISHSLSTV